MTRTDRRRLARELVMPAVVDLLLRTEKPDGYPMAAVWLPGVGSLRIVLERQAKV